MDEAESTKMIPHLIRSSMKMVWIDLYEEADVLYVSFVYLPNAIENEEDEDGIIRNYDKEGELTGLTIIAAKRFAKEAVRLSPQRHKATKTIIPPNC
jgi:uncharacterized protein YuzE